MGARQHRAYHLQNFLQEIRQGKGSKVRRTDKYNHKHTGKVRKWLTAYRGRIVASLRSLSQLHGFVNIVINVPKVRLSKSLIPNYRCLAPRRINAVVNGLNNSGAGIRLFLTASYHKYPATGQLPKPPTITTHQNLEHLDAEPIQRQF